jgi:hypothetical protein
VRHGHRPLSNRRRGGGELLSGGGELVFGGDGAAAWWRGTTSGGEGRGEGEAASEIEGGKAERRRGEARRPAAVEGQLARTRERGSEIWDLGLRGFFPSTRASEIWVLFANFSLPRKLGGLFFAPREG